MGSIGALFPAYCSLITILRRTLCNRRRDEGLARMQNVLVNAQEV